MQIYGVGEKIIYSETIKHLFKPNEMVSHWVILNKRYFYCKSFKVACERYKKLYFGNTYTLWDIDESSEDFSWFNVKGYHVTRRSEVRVDNNCTLYGLKKLMPSEDFKKWFHSTDKFEILEGK